MLRLYLADLVRLEVLAALVDPERQEVRLCLLDLSLLCMRRWLLRW